MPLNLKSTLSSLIIDELALFPKLTAHDLLRHLSHHGPFSTAGLYKELSYLLENGIVVKEKKRFSLGLPWIFSVIAYGQKLQEKYLKSELLSDYLPAPGQRRKWEFLDLLSMDDFWNQMILTLFARCKENIMYEWVPRPWFTLVHPEKEDALQRGIKLLKKKVYMIVGSDGFLDRESTTILSPLAYTISFAEGPFHRLRTQYFDVIDNYVLTIILPPTIALTIDRYFDQYSKKNARLDPRELISLLTFKQKITLKIENNPAKASYLKKKFREYFA